MMCSPEVLASGRGALADLSERLHLLSRFHPPLAHGHAGGRQWERWIAHDLLRRGTRWTQGPGALRLFGTRGASGLHHEIDGASQAHWGTVVVEAKAYGNQGPTKTDVFVFDRKTFDLALARYEAGVQGPHWRLLASLSPVNPQLRKYCYLHGIVVADPALLPIPWLLRAASRPSADLLADAVLWDEIVRLGERAVIPFEVRYSPSEAGLTFDPRLWRQQDLEDLLYVQSELTEQIFAAVDAEQPTFFGDRAMTLLPHIGSMGTAFSVVRPTG